MVHGTFATNFIRENYRNMCHLWRLDGTRTWIFGLMCVWRPFGIAVCPASVPVLVTCGCVHVATQGIVRHHARRVLTRRHGEPYVL